MRSVQPVSFDIGVGQGDRRGVSPGDDQRRDVAAGNLALGVEPEKALAGVRLQPVERDGHFRQPAVGRFAGSGTDRQIDRRIPAFGIGDGIAAVDGEAVRIESGGAGIEIERQRVVGRQIGVARR